MRSAGEIRTKPGRLAFASSRPFSLFNAGIR